MCHLSAANMTSENNSMKDMTALARHNQGQWLVENKLVMIIRMNTGNTECVVCVLWLNYDLLCLVKGAVNCFRCVAYTTHSCAPRTYQNDQYKLRFIK